MVLVVGLSEYVISAEEILKIGHLGNFRTRDLRDLDTDLESGHMAYRRVALIDP